MAKDTALQSIEERVETPYGTVSVTTSPGTPSGTVSLLLLHSNSSSSHAFQHILSKPPPGVSQVVAFDFLGHGESENATTSMDRAYTMKGYAETAICVLQHLQITQYIVLGWSLGGHVAIEMLPLLKSGTSPLISCLGLMLVGTPPSNGAAQVGIAFDVSKTGQVENKPPEPGDEENIGLGAAEHWSDKGARIFMTLVHGGLEPWMLEVGKRTDGRARRIMFEEFRAGTGCDQRDVLEKSDVPCAVVNGASEPFVNLDYLDGVKIKNLWQGKCHRISELGHAPFWQEPEVFQEYLWRFVQDCL